MEKANNTDITTNTNTITPGDNFYLYVNKNWLDNPENAIPSDQSRWGGFVKLNDTSIKQQIQIMQDIDNVVDKSDYMILYTIWKKYKDHMEKWEDPNYIGNNDEYNGLIRELEVLDAYMAFNTPITDDNDYITRIADYHHYTLRNGIRNMLLFDVSSDLQDSNNIVLCVSPVNTILPKAYFDEEKYKNQIEAFKTHLENVSNIINKNTEYKLSDTFASDVFEYYKSISYYNMTSAQKRCYDEYYTNTTLSGIYENINELNYTKTKNANYNTDEKFVISRDQQKLIEAFFENIYHSMDLRNIMKTNYEKNYASDAKIDKWDHVIVYDGDGVRRAFDLLLNKDRLRQYYAYLQYNIILDNEMVCSKELYYEFFNFYNKKLHGQDMNKSVDKRSIGFVNSLVPELLGKIYVEKHFPPESKDDMKRNINIITNIMHESIKNNDWLTDNTKTKALEKLDRFKAKVGYPDIWKDYSGLVLDINRDSLFDVIKKYTIWVHKTEFIEKINSVVDKNKWEMSPQTVNAYFDPTQNEIVFPAAIIQPPFYCVTLNNIDFDITEEIQMVNIVDENIATLFTISANFGGIGAVIAHEITHGYDDMGKKFDSDGNINNWWSEIDDELFKRKTNIMSIQASKIEYFDIATNTKHMLNPELTMGENLADIGGISLGLKSLKQYISIKIDKNDNIYKACLRVFFKAYANIWKQNTKREYFIRQLTQDPHSPPEFRGNLVNNIDDFYFAFDIKETDPMYISPSERVYMW